MINPISKNNDILNLFLENDKNYISQYKDEYIFVEFPVKNVLEINDIEFLSRPDNKIFNTNEISESFLISLKNISNDVFKMKDELKQKKDHKFTFIDLINDNNSFFICSYHGMMRNQKLFLSITFIEVNQIIVDKSYKDKIENILSKCSRIYRFLNYSGLLLHNKEIQRELFLNKNSVTSISKTINEGIFKDRFKVDNLFISSYNTNNTETLFDEERPYFNGYDNEGIWVGNKSQKAIVSDILGFYRKIYGDIKENITLPVWYIENNIIKFKFLNTFKVNDNLYFYNTGISLESLLDFSIITKGNIDIFGDLTIKNPNESIILKVDSKNDNIISNYNIGIGIEDTKSLLEVKGTELTDIMLFLKVQNDGIHEMNKIYKSLEKVDQEKDMIKIMNEISIQNFNQFFSITKMDIINQDNNKLIYHFLFPMFNLKTFSEILEENINLREIILESQRNIQNTLSDNFFFHHSTIINIVDSISGKQLLFTKILKFKGEFYIISFNQIMKKFEKNLYNINMELFFNRFSLNSKILSNVLVQLMKIPKASLTNYENGLSKLKKELKKYNENEINIFSFKYNKNDFQNSEVSRLSYFSLEKSDYIPIHKVKDLNEKSKYISFILNFIKFYKNTFTEGNYGVLSYEDNSNDFVGTIYNLKETKEIDEILLVELNYQSYIDPSLQVGGDIKIKGDLIIENTDDKKNFFNIDPRIKYIGVNNDNRFINYSNDNYLTTSSILNSTHQVHILRDTYPNLVCSRIAENEDEIENKQYDLFSNYSGSTLKRKSNLYSFQEMIDYTKEGNKYNNYTMWDDERYYGVDISYEIEDNSGSTKEIGQVAMTIENIDETGYIRGGWGVSVVDKDDVKFKQRNIIYVNNSGILNINGIRLGNKILKVDDSGDLIWGDKKVKLE